MKKLLLVLMTATSLNALDVTEDDKILHMSFSAFFGMAGNAYCYKELELSEAQSFWCGVGTALVIGGLKELYDKHNGGVADWEDMQANAIGGALGSGFLFLRYEYKW
jgi:uncharacterized protein YfiM (DUF2279 family)